MWVKSDSEGAGRGGWVEGESPGRGRTNSRDMLGGGVVGMDGVVCWAGCYVLWAVLYMVRMFEGALIV